MGIYQKSRCSKRGLGPGSGDFLMRLAVEPAAPPGGAVGPMSPGMHLPGRLQLSVTKCGTET